MLTKGQNNEVIERGDCVKRAAAMQLSYLKAIHECVDNDVSIIKIERAYIKSTTILAFMLWLCANELFNINVRNFSFNKKLRDKGVQCSYYEISLFSRKTDKHVKNIRKHELHTRMPDELEICSKTNLDKWLPIYSKAMKRQLTGNDILFLKKLNRKICIRKRETHQDYLKLLNKWI